MLDVLTSLTRWRMSARGRKKEILKPISVEKYLSHYLSHRNTILNEAELD